MGVKGYIRNLLKKDSLKNVELIDNEGIEGSFSSSPIAVNLIIALKHSGYIALIPNNLDLEALFDRESLINSGQFIEHRDKIKCSSSLASIFDKEGLIHIIDLLNIIPASNKDSITENGFVSINSTRIRSYFKDYLCYLDYLIQSGVIIPDNHYLVGEKSIGYKLAPQYEGAELVEYRYRRFIDSPVSTIPEDVYNKETKVSERNTLFDYPYLSYWYQQKKLYIDADKAKQYAYLLMKKKFELGYDSWDINRDKWSKTRNDYCKKSPRAQYQAVMHNIASIKIFNYKAKIDTNVHRLHSVITNTHKDFRNFFTYDEQPLVSIDISNSQPYLLCLLFNPQFWEANSTISLKLTSLPSNIQSFFSAGLITRILDYTNGIESGVLNEYKLKVSEGQFYEYMRNEANLQFNSNLQRKDIKTMTFMVLFSKNEFFNQSDAKLKRLFAQLHPIVYGLIKLIKSENHASLACLLQAIESEIMLHRCCKRVWEAGNGQIPIFTIHDSIVTTIGNQAFVKRIMEEELTTAIGISPDLTEEFWEEDKLEHQDLLVLIN